MISSKVTSQLLFLEKSIQLNNELIEFCKKYGEHYNQEALMAPGSELGVVQHPKALADLKIQILENKRYRVKNNGVLPIRINEKWFVKPSETLLIIQMCD